MNTCIICQTKQAAQTGICRTCGFPLRPPKFLSEIQYASWMSEEITPRRNQWNNQQKQQELTAQEIAELKQAVAELQKQNLALTSAIQELPELKQRVDELQKQLQSPPVQVSAQSAASTQNPVQTPVQSAVSTQNPVQTPVQSAASVQKPVQPPVQEKQVSAAKKSELTPQQADYIVSSHITEIRDKALWGKSFKTVYIPDSIRIIGNEAFKNCTNLKKIHLPESLTSIGQSAFQRCINLQEIQLPDSLTSIGQSAFQDCSSLREIYLPGSLAFLGARAFNRCSHLQYAYLPESLTSIGNWAFMRCTGLRKIYLPESLKEIGRSAFYNVNATVYYPASCVCKDWVGKNYGGKLVWKFY